MVEYEIVFSSRRTLAININPDGSVIVRAPTGTNKDKIEKFVLDNEDKIQKAKEKFSPKAELFKEASAEEERLLRKRAAELLPGKVRYYAELARVTPGRITVTGARKRFGSCSGKNNLSFSFYLMRFPEEAIDYVVVHELCHIIHHNHSKDFYREIEKILPDYKQRQKLLRS